MREVAHPHWSAVASATEAVPRPDPIIVAQDWGRSATTDVPFVTAAY
jgi:hypothetical protein